MNKKIKTLAMLGSIAAVVAPIAATVSCGNEKAKPAVIDPKDTGVTAIKGAAAGAIKSSYGENVEVGTISPDANKEVEKYWGYSSLRSATHGPADNERKMRNSDGHPKSPNTEYLQWFWNFDPSRVGHGDSDPQVQAARAGSTIAGAESRVVDFWGDTADQKFNRASVPELAPRVYGEKLKDTQSAFTDYDYLNCLEASGGGNDIGFARGRTNPQNYLTADWTYSASESTWRAGTKWPSGPQIDAAHRNGVPITGTITYQGGEWQNDDFLMMIDPGVKGDYPVAKGMVDVADYYGFDGWMINFEGEPKTIQLSGDASTWHGKTNVVDGHGFIDVGRAVTGFMEAWRKYAHADGNKDNPTKFQKDNGFYHRPQMVQAYGGMHATGEYEDGIVNNSDLYYWVQGHGATSSQEITRASARQSRYLGDHSDIFHANSGINWPEDGMTDTMKQMGTTLHDVTRKAGYGGEPAALGSDGKAVGNRINENVTSLWIFSYGQQSVKTDEKFYNSYAGDPRHEGSKKHTSASDGFQERTSVTGHKNWTTDFDWGSGKTFSMWGESGLNNSLIGSSDTGWSAWEMQSFQPTYKWIIDEFDADGKPTVDKNNLPVDSDENVIRKISPNTNNEADDAWFGGTTIDYSGTLNKDESFENKLFASAIPLSSGDKFTIKVKNTDLIKNKKSEVNLLAWTSENPVDVPHLDDKGYFQGANVIRDGTTPYGQLLHAGAPSEWIEPDNTPGGDPVLGFTDNPDETYKFYQKEDSWNYKRNKVSIKPIESKEIGSTGWTELTYDLTKLGGKTLVDFGIQGVAKEDNVNYSGLRLGEMHFEAADNSLGAANKIKMDKFITDKVWDLPTKKTARIQWDNTFFATDGTPLTDIGPIADAKSKVRDYIVYYADDSWDLTSIAWIGANSVAYLNEIDKSKDSQNIVVMAIDNDYNVISQASSTIKLEGGK